MSIVFASFSKDGFVSSVWCRYPHVTHRFASTRFDVYIRLLSCVFVFPSSFKCVKATFVTPSVTFHLHCDTQRWTTLVRLDPVPLHLMRRHLHQAGHDLLTFQSFGSGRLGGWLGLPFPDAWDVVRPAGCRQRGTSNLRRVACICLQTQNRAHESPAPDLCRWNSEPSMTSMASWWRCCCCLLVWSPSSGLEASWCRWVKVLKGSNFERLEIVNMCWLKHFSEFAIGATKINTRTRHILRISFMQVFQFLAL